MCKPLSHLEGLLGPWMEVKVGVGTTLVASADAWESVWGGGRTSEPWVTERMDSGKSREVNDVFFSFGHLLTLN